MCENAVAWTQPVAYYIFYIYIFLINSETWRRFFLSAQKGEAGIPGRISLSLSDRLIQVSG
jgi:hypothetical protein